MKEIDWEDRHFQICLALLSRPEIGLSGATNDPRIPMIIKTADRMVEALKTHVEKQQNATQPLSEEKAPEKPAKKPGGLWRFGMIRAKFDLTKEQFELYENVWDKLQNADFKKGDDIPLSSLSEACQDICDLDEINIHAFERIFCVTISKNSENNEANATNA